MKKFLCFLLLAFALCSPVNAATLFVEGFESSDVGTTTAMDAYSVVEVDGASSEDADLRIQTNYDQNTSNGGNSGAKAAFLDVTTGESRYYQMPADISSNECTASTINVHLPSLHASPWEFEEFRMSSNKGCFLRVNTDGTVSVYYATTGTAFGSSTTPLLQRSCTGDVFRGCDSNDDCLSNSCATCNTNSSGCFMPSVELVQCNTFDVGGDLVKCDLWVNGRHEVVGTNQAAANLGPVTNIRIGATNTESLTRNMYFDSWVVTNSDRARHGWVAYATPVANGIIQWTAPDCDVATNWQCLNDWAAGGSFETNGISGTTRTTTSDKTDDILLNSINPGDASVNAVHYVIVGRTLNNNGTYNYEHSLVVCPTSSTCASTTPVSGSTAKTTTHILLGTGGSATAPGVTPVWNSNTLQQLGIRYKATSIPGGASLRIGAILAYVRGVYPDEPPPPNLKDHNLGIDDGKLTYCTFGDSLAGGTNQQVCPSGVNQGSPCSLDKSCSWSIAEGVGDRPAGGCTADSQCQTCILRRNEGPGGAGFACSSDAQCEDGTCSGDTCSQNSSIPCSVDADCQGLGDDCDATATCDEVCPGAPGGCPEITGWPAGMQGTINVDSIINCQLGGEPSWDLVNNRVDGSLLGNHSTCSAIQGQGRCQCNSDDDCGTSGHCDVNGLCDAGDTNKVLCTSKLTCDQDEGFHCKFDACDYIAILSSANDNFLFPFNSSGPSGNVSGVAANCSEIESVIFAHDPGEACDAGAVSQQCNDNADCANISPTSRCVGSLLATDQMYCVSRKSYSIQYQSCSGSNCHCTWHGTGCRSTADCPNTMTCSTNDPNSTRMEGYCECDSDNDCKVCSNNIDLWCSQDSDCDDGNANNGAETCQTTTFKCVDPAGDEKGQCRYKASSDYPSRPGSYDSSTGTYFGVCTTPCDRFLCSKDSDCPSKSYPNARPGPAFFQGECDLDTGRCKNCGPETCGGDEDTNHAYNNTMDPLINFGIYYQMRRIEQKIANYPDSDGRPVVIPMTQPEYAHTPACRIPLGIYNEATCKVRPIYSNDGCFSMNAKEFGYTAFHSEKIRNNFKNYVDIRTILGRDRCKDASITEICGIHAIDGVHFRNNGAYITGRAVGDYSVALNTCTIGEKPFKTSQKYCQSVSTGIYTSDFCDSIANCDDNELCSVRLCDSDAGCPGTSCNLE